MKTFFLPLLSVPFAMMALAVAAELKNVNLAEQGWGHCSVKESIPAPNIAPPGMLSLLVLPAEPNVVYGEAGTDFAFNGIRVLLSNRTGAELSIGTCDGTLGLIQEAIDKDGKWKPIERIDHLEYLLWRIRREHQSRSIRSEKNGNRVN